MSQIHHPWPTRPPHPPHARATGLPYEPPDGLIAEVAAAARQIVQPEMRDGDTFGAEVAAPPEASRLEQVVAFSGRAIPRT